MKRVIVSGGGTGGHIYPAVAVAEALRRRFGEEVEILFVGAEGKMEMEKVPALGYRIVGLPVAGLQRRFDLKNLAVPFKVLKSIRKARRTIRDFGADVVVGFGGYASGPVLWAAQRMGIPTVIQEQNSYAGVTNKLLAKRARTICVSYEGMERFFPKEKIVMTGNPLRGRFSKAGADRREALAHFGFRDDLPVLLVVGGSLGTRTLNEMMKAWVLRQGGASPVQVIWQTGKYYEREMRDFLAQHPTANIWQGPFIDRMDYAYAAADLVVSRSGPVPCRNSVWWPSRPFSCRRPTWRKIIRPRMPGRWPTRAALLIPDSEAVARVMDEAVGLLKDPARLAELSRNIEALAIPDSAERIVNEIERQLPQSK